MSSKRKNPKDYPQFTFRVDSETKLNLTQNIEEVLDLYNKTLDPNGYKFRKNNIIVKALELGLEQMKKDC